MMSLMIWTMMILPCNLLILRHLKMEELKAEIEKLEEKMIQEELNKKLDLVRAEDSQVDYSIDYFDKFLEPDNNSNFQENGEKGAIDNENKEIRDDELEEDDTGCDGPEFDEYYGEFCPKEYRIKRDTAGDFLGGIVQTGERLLEGNIGGSITSFLKTVARPIYHYFIKSDNDPAMEKFTNRFVPETNFHGASNAIVMQGAVEAGDGGRVWDTMKYSSEAWNPRSSWTHIKDRSQSEKLAFKRDIPTILAIDKTITRRLKDVSLVITTLATSLHDTLVEGMNTGFKTASEILKNMEDDNRSIVGLLKNLVEVIESDMPTDLEIAAITVIIILIILQLGVGFWQTKATQLQIESVVQDMGKQLEELQQVIKDAEVKEAKMKKQLEDIVQDKKQLENEFTVAIAQAIEQAMSSAIEDARFQSSLKLQSSRVDQMQAGPRIKGKTVSFNDQNTLALLNSGQ